MALNDIFAEGELCPTCNKNLNNVVNGIEFCGPCEKGGDRSLAKLTVFEHLVAALVCLFNFRFEGFLAEIIWAIERLFKFGDYHPVTGKFYTLGYMDN